MPFTTPPPADDPELIREVDEFLRIDGESVEEAILLEEQMDSLYRDERGVSGATPSERGKAVDQLCKMITVSKLGKVTAVMEQFLTGHDFFSALNGISLTLEVLSSMPNAPVGLQQRLQQIADAATPLKGQYDLVKQAHTQRPAAIDYLQAMDRRRIEEHSAQIMLAQRQAHDVIARLFAIRHDPKLAAPVGNQIFHDPHYAADLISAIKMNADALGDDPANAEVKAEAQRLFDDARRLMRALLQEHGLSESR